MRICDFSEAGIASGWSADILVRSVAGLNTEADKNVRAPKIEDAHPQRIASQNDFGSNRRTPILDAMLRVLPAMIYVPIFLTGATGLVYQVVWQRYLARLLGNDSTAIAVVLAVFLAGLSSGYWLCGRWTVRLRRPFRGYALLECGIGLWALLFPQLFAAVDSLTRSWSFAPTIPLLVQGVLCAALLTGFPALCMGGTVPLLTRGLARDLTAATRTHALIYGTNTAGACVGALAAGFWFIAAVGLPGTLRGAAVVNLMAALVFVLLPWRPPSPNADLEVAAEASGSPSRAGSSHGLYALGFLSGAYVMMLENVLIRVTNLSFGSSSYSFSLIVAVFVGCIALGSLWVGFRLDRHARDTRSPRDVERRFTPAGSLLFWNQAGIALSLLLLFLLLDKGPYFAHLVRICFQPNLAGFWLFQATTLAALLLILLLPVSMAGATLPILFHQLKRDLPTVGARAGTLFSLNAAGCVVGSLCGGLLLYTWLDNAGVFLAAAALAAGSTLLAGWRLSAGHRTAAAVVLLTAVAFLLFRPCSDAHRFAFGTFRLATATPFSFAGARLFYKEFYRDRQVRFYRDGASGTVAVLESPDLSASSNRVELPFGLPGFAPPPAGTNGTGRAIIVNGKSDSHVEIDRETLKLTAHLPALWATKRSKVMIVGLGTGVTAGDVARYPEVETIDVAEISPDVVAALPLFRTWTGDVHEDPRLHIHVGDAFRVIGRTRAKWDILISEPSNPWVTGVDQLFSREYYRLVRAHLNEDGVFLQWVQQYAFNTEAFGIVAATVKSVFPYFTVFQGRKGDLIILARSQPFAAADRVRAERILRDHPAVRASLAQIGIASFQDILRRERPLLAAVAGQLTQYGIETLDRPRLHFLAGRTFFTGEELGNEPISPFGPSGTVLSRKVLEGQPDLPVPSPATK